MSGLVYAKIICNVQSAVFRWNSCTSEEIYMRESKSLDPFVSAKKKILSFI